MTQLEDTSLADHPFRGFLQTLLAIVIGLTFTAICWCVWARIAHRRLLAQMDAIAALHQPFNEADFPAIHLPDEQNAAVIWRAAIAAKPANDTCPSGSNLVFNDYPPFSSQWEQMEDQSIADNAKMFKLAHRAAACEAEWGVGARSAFNAVPYNGSRAVANILGDAVLHAHLHGNDALAIQRVNELLSLSRAIGSVGNLISRLVGVGIDALCLDRLLSITPDLAIEGDPANSPGQVGVGRHDIERLIARLLDEREDIQLRINAVDSERTVCDQDLKILKKPLWTLAPMIDLSEARTLAQRAIDRRAAEAESDGAVGAIYQASPTLLHQRNVLLKAPPTPSTSAEWAAVIEEGGMASFRRYFSTEWGISAEGRAAAIALSIRLYRLDHGDLPVSLAPLVPAYLPAVPLDPFGAAGSPIGYVIRKSATPDGRDRPMLYFNVTGDPKKAALPPAPIFGWTGQGSQWRDLSRWYPVVPATAPAAAS